MCLQGPTFDPIMNGIVGADFPTAVLQPSVEVLERYVRGAERIGIFSAAETGAEVLCG